MSHLSGVCVCFVFTGPLDTSTESSQNTLLLLDAPPPRRTRSQRYTRPAPLTICPAPEVYSFLVEEGQVCLCLFTWCVCVYVCTLN